MNDRATFSVGDLHRGIASAMQHQIGVLTDQARTVDPQAECCRLTLRLCCIDELLCLGVIPSGLHIGFPERLCRDA